MNRWGVVLGMCCLLAGGLPRAQVQQGAGIQAYVLPTSVFMEFGRFDKVTNKRAEIVKSVNFTQEPPSVGVAALNNLNTSSAKSLTETADAAGKTGMHGFFVNVVKERSKGSFNSNLTSLKKRIKGYYAEESSVFEKHIADLRELVEDASNPMVF